MSTYRILAATLAAIVSLNLAGCGNRDLNYKTVETEELKKEVRDLEALLDACEKRRMSGAIESAGSESNDPNWQGRNIGKGTSVSSRPMETVIEIESNVLFTPGSAKLTSDAKATLSRAIELIKQKYPNHYVRVDGHTDNAQITRSKDKWDDNWDLSGGRAQAVLHYLLDHGVAAKDLGFAGFGQERPKVSNSSDANKSKNRRVEIVVIPKQ
jgi:flagellar motor protein MotB